jgi:inversin
MCVWRVFLAPSLTARVFFRRTPLQCAAFGGHVECMSLLLQSSASIDARDKDVRINVLLPLSFVCASLTLLSQGICALHWAASNGNIQAVKLLCERGAFLNQMEVDQEKLTPLDYALISNEPGACQVLLR